MDAWNCPSFWAWLGYITLQPIGQPETQFWAGGEWIWTGNVVAGITNELIAPQVGGLMRILAEEISTETPQTTGVMEIMDLGSFVGRLLHNQVLLLLMVQI